MIINCIYCHFFVIGKLINFTFVDDLVKNRSSNTKIAVKVF